MYIYIYIYIYLSIYIYLYIYIYIYIGLTRISCKGQVGVSAIRRGTHVRGGDCGAEEADVGESQIGPKRKFELTPSEL